MNRNSNLKKLITIKLILLNNKSIKKILKLNN